MLVKTLTVFWLILVSVLPPIETAAAPAPNLVETSFLTMTLPEGWSCKLQNTEWLCGDQKRQTNNYALIVISAKEAAPEDNMQSFEKRLTTPIMRPTSTGVGQSSKVIRFGKLKIGGHEWADGVHLGSEIENYFTRYLSTRHGPLAILLNFTVHKDYSRYYGEKFVKSINSIRLKPVSQLSPSPAPTDPNGIPPIPDAAPRALFGFTLPQLMIAAFILVAILFVALIMKRNK